MNSLRPGAVVWLALGTALLGGATLLGGWPQKAAEPVPVEAARPDLNRATAREVAGTRGIGPGLARRLSARRRALSGFRRWEELRSVRGVGPAKLDILRREWDLPPAGKPAPGAGGQD